MIESGYIYEVYKDIKVSNRTTTYLANSNQAFPRLILTIACMILNDFRELKKIL